jgi:CheY-like chemotaxis protein
MMRTYEEAYKEGGFEYVLKKFNDAKKTLNYFVIHAKEVFIIISDISMPGKDGPALLDTINENHELKMEAVPFIFFSNSNVKKDVLRAYTQAAQGYFQKPMGVDEMTDLFKSMIDYWSRAQIPKD